MEKIKMKLQGEMSGMAHRTHLVRGRFHLTTFDVFDEPLALNPSVRGVGIEF